jgi:hypothetical protein
VPVPVNVFALVGTSSSIFAAPQPNSMLAMPWTIFIVALSAPHSPSTETTFRQAPAWCSLIGPPAAKTQVRPEAHFRWMATSSPQIPPSPLTFLQVPLASGWLLESSQLRPVLQVSPAKPPHIVRQHT